MSFLSKNGIFLLRNNKNDVKEEPTDVNQENEDMWIYCHIQMDRAARGLVGREAQYVNKINSLRPWFDALSESERDRIKKKIEFDLNLLIQEYD